ncbi:MAG: hypothetical protein WDW36_004345 [Sanguina aurantia]
MEHIVVIDNGSGTCKVGFAGRPAPERVFPNGTAKLKGESTTLVGDELIGSREVSELALRRPFDKGYLVDWKMEREVWSRALRTVLKVQPRECGLVLSEPMFNFPQLQAVTEQIVFEEFGFQSCYIAPAPLFSLQRGRDLQPHIDASRTGCGIVVDAGYSFTHIVPFFNGLPVLSGVKRINVGGKLLTSYLKELISFRHFNVMDETFLVEAIKEKMCFVSGNVRADLKLASQPGLRSPHRREFVLKYGEYKSYYKELSPAAAAAVFAAGGPPVSVSTTPPPEAAKRLADKVESQVLPLNNERFMVPEVLFNPSDIGLYQAGLAEAVALAVRAVHPALQPLITENVLLTGGLACCPGLLERFEAELRPQLPEECGLHVFLPRNPDLCAWEGMSQFGASRSYRAMATTRAQYEEKKARAQGR